MFAGVETIRAFIAINLSEELAAKLEALKTRLDTLLPAHSVRWVQPQQIHLTLKFLGNISAESVEHVSTSLIAACAGTQPFVLRAGQSGCFPNLKRPRVVWIGVEGDVAVLRDLQARIDAATRELSEHSESREWQPHLTIGRVSKNARPRELRKIGEVVSPDFESAIACAWPVRSVELMRSQLGSRGAVYTCVTSVKL